MLKGYNMLSLGDFWRICDRCSIKVAASKTVYQVDDYGFETGMIVCRSCFDEPQIPLEDILISEDHLVTDPRPQGENIILEPGEVKREDL